MNAGTSFFISPLMIGFYAANLLHFTLSEIFSALAYLEVKWVQNDVIVTIA
jgi:hypothetical protein